ncbi:MAG: TetR/AcrR family transcriptional regulator C-terminal domain-containing protein [Pseudolabrys sp.]|nr:TetR/AcrR family transcriptional regulator C-terminal domain-containing protein [Pseudolabrys sp.]
MSRLDSECFGPGTPSQLVTFPYADCFGDDDGDDLRAVLIELGRRLLTTMTSPWLLSIYRAAIDPAASPDLARKFYENGPGSVAAGLAEMLGAAAEKGTIDAPDCKVSAAHFISLVRGNLQFEVSLGLRPAPSPVEIDAIVKVAVDAFLRIVEPAKPRDVTLEEALADPIVQAVMRRDGVTASDIRRLVARLRSDAQSRKS